jgi:hypothetical protein
MHDSFFQVPVKVTFAPNVIDEIEEKTILCCWEIQDWELLIFRAEDIWTGKETGW